MSDTLNPELFNLAMSEQAQPLMDAVKKHIKENVEPIMEEFNTLQHEKEDRWSWHPRQLELLEGAKTKAMVPEKVCQIIDAAIQIHGATGISKWTPLAGMYTDMRHLRFADGPDEVHHMVVGRAEVQQYGLW